jgi:polysaccharide biosynthesis protein PslH
VVVAPLRFGAGTQNKVLESMAVGTPVICTEVGFKGIGVDSGQGAILAPDQESFVTEVIHVLDNPDYRYRISFAGKNIVQSRYSWQSVAGQLLDYMVKLRENS